MTERTRLLSWRAVPPPATGDLVAGVSVALVLIPQAMAYAELAGVPPQVGLVAGALPPLLAAPFVSSPYLQTGPVALTGLLTYGALEGLAEPFSVPYVKLAMLLALLVGLIRLVLGLVRLGSIAYLLSSPVMTGFTTGAAILIVASQLPRALGSTPGGNGVLRDAFESATAPGEWRAAALLFVTVTALLTVGGRRLHQLFPGVLFAVIGSIVVSRLGDFDVETIGSLPGGFVSFHADFPWRSTASLLPAAFAIAVVGFAEPSSIARAFAAQDRQTWNADQEMISQGVANVTSAFSGGIPVGGSFSRSALSRMAGATTSWAGAITGLFVLLTLPLTPLAESLPRSVLAAIVITSVLKLIDVRALFRLFVESWPQGVVGVGTVVATIAFSPHVERGVFIGVGLAVAVHLYRELNIGVTEAYHDGVLTIGPQGVLWFATVPKIERLARTNIARHPELTTVIFDLVGVGRLDYTGAATLRQAIVTLELAGVDVTIANVPPGARRAVQVHLGDIVEIDEPAHDRHEPPDH